MPINSRLFLAHSRLHASLERHGTDDRLAAEEWALDLLQRVLRQSGGSPSRRFDARPGTRRRWRTAVADAQAFLAEHFSDSLSLDDVATAACYSKYHLSRVFSVATGTSIHQYRNRLRLRAALQYLLDPMVDLSAVAFAVGFSSHSHFTEAFRTEFGSTPSEVRGAFGTDETGVLRRRIDDSVRR